MYGTKHWIATTLAAALLITPATLGARAQGTTGDAPAVLQPAPTSAAPESAPITDSAPTPSPADATAPADPLADAAMAGVHDALTVLPAAVRAALSPDDLREALLASTLRAADPRARPGLYQNAPARCKALASRAGNVYDGSRSGLSSGPSSPPPPRLASSHVHETLRPPRSRRFCGGVGRRVAATDRLLVRKGREVRKVFSNMIDRIGRGIGPIPSPEGAAVYSRG